jgi:glycosyltransferase involved in cell wall biosynthesis
MAAGLPVITTDRGAIAESVVDGENGFIVAAGRPDEIAAKVRLLAGDPELRRKMGRQSRERYERLFTEKKMVAAMAVAFRAAMGGGR